MIALGKKYGEASKLRVLKSGAAFDHLFEKAPGQVYTVKKNSDLADTLKLIPKVVGQTSRQTSKIADHCKGASVYETCRKIWQFVYDHIQYRKDKQGYEQIRSPRRTWHDRKQGVDCDCYSVFISSILTNLGIPQILRITKYNADHFQHIYPVVPFNGRHITIDCVTDAFDYEVPYSEKKDYPMDLQYLDGIPDDGIDGYDLGKLFKKKKGGNAFPANTGPSAVPGPKKKKGLFSKLKPKISKPAAGSAPKKKKGIFKKIGSAVKKINVKKVVSKINKINPAAVALRNGVLAAMKLNVKNIAARLYWSYQSPEQAAAANIDADKLNSLTKTRKKLENIFSTAGGKVSNLEKAIRKGKEHSDKKKKKKGVNGLDGLDALYGDLQQVLGYDMYHSENVEGLDGLDAVEGLGQLGEPVTLATVGAAMGVLTGIITQLKQIGNIFKGKSEGSEDFDEAVNEAAENNQPVPGTTPIPETATNPILPESIALPDAASNESQPAEPTSDESGETDTEEEAGEPESNESDSNMPNGITKTSTEVAKKDNNTPDKESFWQKKWVKPTAVIGGSLLLLLLASKALGGSKERNKSSPRAGSLNGIPYKRKKHKRKKKRKKITAIALQ